MELDPIIMTIEDTLREDLERCEAAIRAGASDDAVTELERAFAKLDSALDALRSVRGQVGRAL